MLLAIAESMAREAMEEVPAAIEVALDGLRAARQMGRQASPNAAMLANNAACGLTWQGRTAEAAALIDPLTSGQADRDHWIEHLCRVEIDMLRGDITAAEQRVQQVNAIISRVGRWYIGAASLTAELALWTGRPTDAVEDVRKALEVFKPPEMAFLCGSLLTAGMRACADLADNARARRDEPAAAAAQAAAGDLASWVNQMAGAPFADHRYLGSIPAERATWDAERTRLEGTNDPAAWNTAARAWEDLGRPHRAGYAWWRYAEARLSAGQRGPAADALRTAAAAASGHVPLLAQIRALAQRARITLHPQPAAPPAAPGQPQAADAYGLTTRELTVLRLLAVGRTNAQIGAELYISPKTASVHVTSILRKLGVTSRVHAAAQAERAGLLAADRP